MAMMYPTVNGMFADIPESASLVQLRQLRVPLHDPSTHSCETTGQTSNDGQEGSGPHASNESAEESAVYNIAFRTSSDDDVYDDEEGDIFGDHHHVSRSASDGTDGCDYSAVREASSNSAEPLVPVDLPPPYTPSATRSRFSRTFSYAHIDDSSCTGSSHASAKMPRHDRSRMIGHATPSLAHASSSTQTPPLVLELFMGHRLATKLAQRRAKKRAQQLDGVHEKWHALGIDTRDIVASASPVERDESAADVFVNKKTGSKPGFSTKGQAGKEEDALRQVKAAKHLLPHAFWQPPNYGPQEMDRRLRALGL